MRWMAALLLLGCSKAAPPPAPPPRTEPRPSIHPVGPSTILVIRGVGATATKSGDVDLGIWRIMIEERGERTVLAWSISQMEETDSSVARRATAEERGEEPPEPLFEIVKREGRLTLEETAAARAMFPPAYWEDERTLRKNGGLWLSFAAYDELKATGRTEWSVGSPDRKEGTSIVSKGTEEYELKVKGAAKKLPVIRARTDRTTLLILDDPGNPLILKLEPDPQSGASITPILSTGHFASMRGYEIAEIQ